MKKVSIIIPNYNGEKYLKRCLDSVVNQDYNRKEIIIVDDGSSDKSLDIIKSYGHKVRLYKNKHHGPNMARKTGLDNASGEYIMFIDSDDYITDGAIKTLMAKFDEYDVDVIRFNYCRENNKTIMNQILNDGVEEMVISNNKIFKLLLTTYKLNSLWCQIYKKDLLSNIKAFETNIKNGEDFIANLEIHEKTKSMLILNGAPLYIYCENPDSTTRTLDHKKIVKNIEDRIAISKVALGYIGRINKKMRAEAIFQQIKMIRDCIIALNKLDSYKKQDFIKDFKRILPVDSFTMIDKSEFKKAIKEQSLIPRTKYGKIVMSIVTSNYDAIWSYLRIYKILKKGAGK